MSLTDSLNNRDMWQQAALTSTLRPALASNLTPTLTSTLRSHCAVMVWLNWERVSCRPRPRRGRQLQGGRGSAAVKNAVHQDR